MSSRSVTPQWARTFDEDRAIDLYHHIWLRAEHWEFDPEISSFVIRKMTPHQFFIILKRAKTGRINVTPGIMKSITRTDWKRELVEAICLRKVQPKEKS